MPKPKYTSASAIMRMLSALPPAGPSPSELVGALTTLTSQPTGASASSRSRPSAVSAQFRDVDARSTTITRRSVNVHSANILVRHEGCGRDLELPRRPGQLELERSVLGVVVDPLGINPNAV